MPLITNQEAGIFVLLGILFVIFFLCGKKGKLAFAAALLTVALLDPVCHYLAKPFIARPRPCQLGVARLLVECGSGYSMPSLHAANAFGIMTAVVARLGKRASFLYILPVAVAYSRMYVGVHWFFDVVVGAALGVAVGLLVSNSINKGYGHFSKKMNDRKPKSEIPINR
jgi:undecaprenyl-diphosphatase